MPGGARVDRARPAVIASLSDKRLLIVTGKGGVGKTTIATALALDAARRGKRTLVCEVNTKERVSQLLGKPEVGPEITSLVPRLAIDLQSSDRCRFAETAMSHPL